jgi:hypothetical protein
MLSFMHMCCSAAACVSVAENKAVETVNIAAARNVDPTDLFTHPHCCSAHTPYCLQGSLTSAAVAAAVAAAVIEGCCCC